MNTLELVSALKIKGSWPTSQDLFSNDDFLTLFNMRMQVEIVPMMLRLNEEFFLQSKTFPISKGTLYRIPKRAIGAKLRDLQMVDVNNNYTPISRLFEEDRKLNKSGYYMMRNGVVLTDDYVSNTLEMTFFARPNKLVDPSKCAQITAIVNGTDVQVNAAPSTFTTGVLCDLVQNSNPYDLLNYDQAIVGLSGTTITFASLPQDLDVGDWVCLANEAPVPMVPDEVHPLLVQSALVSTLASKKDKALDYEQKELESMKEDLTNMLDPRVENASVKFRSGKLLNYFSSRRW